MSYRMQMPQMLVGAALVAASLSLVGCSDTRTATTESSTATGEHADHDHDQHDHGEHDHSAPAHGEWWCGEHGVPEEECAQCDKSLVAEFKAKGDWCEEHNRPESQCFIHHPENFEKFATLYEAKFGERPEMPTE